MSIELCFNSDRAMAPSSAHQLDSDHAHVDDIPEALIRHDAAALPALSELEAVRHYTCLSQLNYSIDTHFYPLGSCSMKYNPRAARRLAHLEGFVGAHPLWQAEICQGTLACLYELQTQLAVLTGMKQTVLSPMAGAQGEWAGVAMIRAYHQARGDAARTVILVPDAAHGTNPASATRCGFEIREVATLPDGDLDLEALDAALGPDVAGLMLTNPSTLGVFERQIETITAKVHAAGGLNYYDGANLNAILGRVRPGDMGFDVLHLNLHKTFATPHGGGGPGAGPVIAVDRLVPYLPHPYVTKAEQGYDWTQPASESIGRLSTFMGNIGVLLQAYVYLRLLGRQGVRRVSSMAVLNAAYVQHALSSLGYVLAFPERRASHEFVITLDEIHRQTGVRALDVAKRLLDFGIHAPTMYFPLCVPECLLIEPTETESKATLDQFIAAMSAIWNEIQNDPESLKQAPYQCVVGRLDEVKAARTLDVADKD